MLKKPSSISVFVSLCYFPGNMQNLTAREKNLTDFECGLCLRTPVFRPGMLSYVLISLPANGRVLWLMISSPVFWTDRMEVFEFHLVLTELLFGFLGPPLIIITFYSSTAVADAVIKFINIIFTARMQFQSSVCMERYLAVVHPVLYLRYKPLRYRMSFCSVIWLQTILFAIIQMLFCTEKLASLAMYTTSFFSVFIINSFCCLSVLRALKQPSPGEGEREGSNLIKKRAFNIVLIFQLTTFVGYVPLVIMFFLVKEIDWDVLCILQPLAYCVMVWLGAIYPLLYLRRAGKHQVRNDLCVNRF